MNMIYAENVIKNVSREWNEYDICRECDKECKQRIE